MRYILLLLYFTVSLYSSDKYVFISNQNFPLSRVNADQIKQIYLKRLRFIKEMPIVAVNYPAHYMLRAQFEKEILKMSSKQLHRYWMKEHYLGTRPPVVQSSIESAIMFVKNVDGAIAYIPYDTLPEDVRILYISKEKP